MIPKEFLKILNTVDPFEVVQKYLLDNFPYCFSEKPELYSILRNEICEKFEIHPNNFAIIGSAKMGFSLSPLKFGQPFSDHSDIDIVLVSERLFQLLWLKLINFQRSSIVKLDPRYKKRFNELQYSFFFGLVRLDKLSNDFDFAKIWWEFFNYISVDKRFGPRRIRAALFKSWNHVSNYYVNSIERIKIKHESISH